MKSKTNRKFFTKKFWLAFATFSLLITATVAVPTFANVGTPTATSQIRAENFPVGSVQTVDYCHFLNVRRGPGVNYAAFTFLARGAQVTVLEFSRAWVRIDTERGEGWISAAFLSRGNNPSTASVATTQGRTPPHLLTAEMFPIGSVATVDFATAVNVRRGAGNNFTAFTHLHNGATVTVLEYNNGWVRIDTPRGEGWMFGGFLANSAVMAARGGGAAPAVAAANPSIGALTQGSTQVSSAAQTRSVSIPAGNRNVTFVEIDILQNYNIYAVSALSLLGRQTATLPEFATAFSHRAGDDMIIFPVNYLRSTGDHSVIGGLFSQGVLDSGGEDWFHWAAAFDWGNWFSVQQGLPNGSQSAFTAYPFLMQNGARFNVQPNPGMDANFLNASAFRAFMGQRADGTFVVGNVPSTTIFQLQDVVQEFGLINAVNMDGGASVGLWRNGEMITTPGRQLASVAIITNSRAPQMGQAPPLGNQIAQAPAPPAPQAPAPPVFAPSPPSGPVTIFQNTPHITRGGGQAGFQVGIPYTIQSGPHAGQAIYPPFETRSFGAGVLPPTVFVSVGVIADILGWFVDWNAATQTATFTLPNGDTAVFTNAQATFTHNGQTRQMINADGSPAPAFISNDRLMLPIHILDMELGTNIGFEVFLPTFELVQVGGWNSMQSTSFIAAEVIADILGWNVNVDAFGTPTATFTLPNGGTAVFTDNQSTFVANGQTFHITHLATGEPASPLWSGPNWSNRFMIPVRAFEQLGVGIDWIPTTTNNPGLVITP
ncbi:MAG: SH3 domain-containing protein [Turicibacter sp.]|nr:SH3 domain-containing protein [Turicibacter sp.]